MMQVKLPTLPLLSLFALTATALLAAPAPPTSFAEARQAVAAFATPAAAPRAAPKVQLAAATPATRTAAAAPAAHVQPEGLMAIHRWLKPGEFAWDDEGVAPGRVTVVVDVRARTLSVYRSGVEIGRSSLIYGADDKPTPTGTFPILQKRAEHYSNLYDGAPMPWMLRLTHDGVAIHGSKVEDDAATHGCIGLPDEFAELLFGQAKIGDKVIVVPGPPKGTPYTAYAALPRA
jgi:lipoprotein-anchoring transpeptidase ErfK/SrfK